MFARANSKRARVGGRGLACLGLTSVEAELRSCISRVGNGEDCACNDVTQENSPNRLLTSTQHVMSPANECALFAPRF